MYLNLPKSVVNMYKEDESEEVLRILRANDYQSVLSVDDAVTKGELKLKYKECTRKVHPDRNRSPEAVDAFKTLTDAVTALSDRMNGRNYNQFPEPICLRGNEENMNANGYRFVEINEKVEKQMEKPIFEYFQNYRFVKRPTVWQRVKSWMKLSNRFVNFTKPAIKRTKERLTVKRRKTGQFKSLVS